MRCLAAFALVVAACSSAPPDRAQPTSPTVTAPMPLSNDPGRVEDKPPLQQSPTGSGSNAGEVRYPDANGKPDGAQCLSSIECASGVCEGQGCTNDKPGTCASKSRICTMDMRPYCGCDNKQFNGSSTCPGRRYMSRGNCTGGS